MPVCLSDVSDISQGKVAKVSLQRVSKSTSKVYCSKGFAMKHVLRILGGLLLMGYKGFVVVDILQASCCCWGTISILNLVFQAIVGFIPYIC